MKNEMKSLPTQEEDLSLKVRRMANELYTFFWFPSLQSVMWRRRLDKSGNSQLNYDGVSGEYYLSTDDEINIGLFALNLDYISMVSVAGLVYSTMNNLDADSLPVSYLPSVALFILSRYVASPAVSMLADKYGDEVSELVKSLSVSNAYYDQDAFGTDKYPMDLRAFSSTDNSDSK